jgi:putative ABC transport system permease protein
MNSVLQDFRYALRSMARERGFALVAILTLAFGLGANTAIFSVVNSILLRPLPYAKPDRLLIVSMQNIAEPGDPGFELSYLNIKDLNERMKTLQGVGGYLYGSTFMMEGAEPQHVAGAYLTANTLPLLGVKPQLGRFFSEAEDREGAAPVMVISHDLWVSSFGRDPNIIGKSFLFGTAGKRRTVIGVMPAGFKFPADVEKSDYWAPLQPAIGKDNMAERGAVFIDVIGRLRDGVALSQAQAEAEMVSGQLEKAYPKSNTDIRFRLTSMHDVVVRQVKPALVALLAAVVGVLLIACANVANLLLARAAGRHREISIRTAIGASRGRIVRQLLIESVVLSVIAGACGLLIATWGVAGLLAIAPKEIPRVDTVRVDGTVLAFSAILSIVTGIVFGLAPALAASKTDLTESLKEGSRGSTEGRKRNRIRNTLVAAEIALSVLLLTGAGLLLRSFVRLSGVDPGYDYHNALVVEISARAAYDNDEKIVEFFRRVVDGLGALPGVTSAGAVNHIPLGGNENVFNFQVAGEPTPPIGKEPNVTTVSAMPNYFHTMGIPLLAGRDFTNQDNKTGTPAIIISESFARKHFPKGNAIGQHMSVSIDERAMREIVGVVGDVHFLDLASVPRPIVYLPEAQVVTGRICTVLRTRDAAVLIPQARAVIKRIDPQQPIVRIRTLEEIHSASLENRRFIMILIGALASLALVLAGVGIYSIMNYAVTQRTPEIGIRMALGAEPRDVSRLIVGHALRLVGAGIGAGIVAAFIGTRLIRSLLYGTAPSDPATFVSICVAIVIVATLASWIPARRAAAVDPLVAIRNE